MTRPDVLLTPPDAAEVAVLGRGVVTAVRGPGGLTPVQDLLVRALFHSMTGYDIDPAGCAPISSGEFAAALSRRNEIFRTRIVQIMLLVAFVVRPLPLVVADRLRRFAEALAVRDDMVDVAEQYAAGALEVAGADFAPNGYLASLSAERLAALHAPSLDSSWGQVADDPELAARWQSLAELPVGTLGRGVADFYRDRGFAFPGLPGSAPPLLAQHDWVHVLAGYGTTLENELEVFAFIARANDDPRGFSLLAMIVSLFETGNLAAGAGLFEANPGHLRETGMAVRVADAMRRGALTRGSQDFLGFDWFELADRPVADLRREFEIPDKSPEAIAAGSRGAWEDGGITPFQLNSARVAAELADRPYVPWAPDPSRA
jgi:hypothetical protein